MIYNSETMATLGTVARYVYTCNGLRDDLPFSSYLEPFIISNLKKWY